MKYYAITKGTYSDYHIITITADKEKAKQIAQWHSDGYDDARVEEYKDSIEVVLPVYTIYLENGRIRNLWASKYDNYDEDKLNKIMGLNGSIKVRAKGVEHAKKIAYDLIAEYKTKNEGIV